MATIATIDRRAFRCKFMNRYDNDITERKEKRKKRKRIKCKGSTRRVNETKGSGENEKRKSIRENREGGGRLR